MEAYYQTRQIELYKSNVNSGLDVTKLSTIGAAVALVGDYKLSVFHALEKLNSGSIGKGLKAYGAYLDVLGRVAGVPGAIQAWSDYSVTGSTEHLLKASVSTIMVIGKVTPYVGLTIGILDVTGVSDKAYEYLGDLYNESF